MRSGFRLDVDVPAQTPISNTQLQLSKVDQIIQRAKLPTPPAVALQVVKAASDPDSSPREIAAILSRDPVLCGKVLKAVNSCIFGTGKQTIASVDWAVVNLGVNALRSLVLGLSLPVAQSGRKLNPAQRDFWIGSVSGAILAMELSAKLGGGTPGLDLVAGLLRDLGLLAMYDSESGGWDRYHALPIEELLADPCGAEERIFGVHHVEVSVRILENWKLPPDIIEPIRHHHSTQSINRSCRSWQQRAELLQFVEWLVKLDQVVEVPHLLRELLKRAEMGYGLSQSELIAFLQAVEPKITEFNRLLDLDLHEMPCHADILTKGCETLVNLTIQSHFTGLNKISADPVALETHAILANEKTANIGMAQTRRTTAIDLPPFTAAMMAQASQNGFQLDGYQIRRELGRGAMGVVFHGFDPALNREVAVKVMAPEFAHSEEARLRFAREAQSLAAIRNEHVVGVFDFGVGDGLPYLVMEYIQGGSLEDRLAKSELLSWDQIVLFGSQIARGLAAIHDRGIVHRDIKPANVMIESGRQIAKISDFGLARGSEHGQLTQTGALIGSPLFMSPEMLDGVTVGPESDLFSLGSVFYQMGTGRLPFDAVSIAAIFRKITLDMPPEPIQFRPDLPREFNDLVMEMLRKNPRERIGDARLVADRLEKLRR